MAWKDRKAEAVAAASAEEDVRRYRLLAESDPAHLPQLARALNNLGIHYSHAGRRAEAVAVTEEAVRLYGHLAETDMALLPDLAGMVSNLGARYAAVDRQAEAVAAADEAVRLCRHLAQTDPAHLPQLVGALVGLKKRCVGAGRLVEAVPPAVEAVTLCRRLVESDSAHLPNLAAALGDLGRRHIAVRRLAEAVPPFEEAVRLYRHLAESDPARLSDLAMALDDLGACYLGVGRRDEAVSPVEESVRLYRGLAKTDPVHLPHLANALNDLGASYAGVGRFAEAVTPTEEAVGLYRRLAETDPAHLPRLASALGNLGSLNTAVGRIAEAVASTEEVVGLYRGLVGADLESLPELARALNDLTGRCARVGDPDRAEAAWQATFATVGDTAAAYLHTARAAAVEPGHPHAARWLVEALRLADRHRDLIAPIHIHARRHRSADPAGFDTAWSEHTGEPAPAWLRVDAALLSAAQGWLAAEIPASDYLAAHPELLTPAADDAITEALLPLDDKRDAERYAALRQAAQASVTETARTLAREFVQADSGGWRALLTERRNDLLSGPVRRVLIGLAKEDNTGAVRRAQALLDLAALGEHGPVLGAVAEPARFPGLLSSLAARPALATLRPAVLVALATTATWAELATATFFYAVVVAIGGDRMRAEDLLAQAREADPDQSSAWADTLAEVGRVHPEVLPLIPALVAPPSATEPPGEDG